MSRVLDERPGDSMRPTLPASERDRRPNGFRLAQAACVLGVLFAAVSAYWAVGGTWLLDTVGGSLERQARAGHASAVLVPAGAAAAKLVAALLPLFALGRLSRPPWRSRTRALAWVEAAVLTFYGLVYTSVGLLLQVGVVRAPAGSDLRALAWHTYLWDPWFLVWGLLVGAVLLRSRTARSGA